MEKLKEVIKTRIINCNESFKNAKTENYRIRYNERLIAYTAVLDDIKTLEKENTKIDSTFISERDKICWHCGQPEWNCGCR